MLIGKQHIALAFWLCYFVGTALSQEQSPRPLIASEPKHQEPSNSQVPSRSDQRVTDQSPVVVKVQEPQKSQTDISDARQDRNNKATYDWDTWLLSTLTVIVGFLTFIVIGLQAFFLWRTVRVSEKAANAAEKSAGAIISSERAYVFVRAFLRLELRNNLGQITGWQCVVVWENSGTTPTKDLNIYVSWQSRTAPIPMDFDFPDLGRNDSEISQNFLGPRAQTNTTAFQITVADAVALMRQQTFMYIWGRAEYRDIFPTSQLHRTEFCNQVIGVPIPANPNAAMIEFRIFQRHNTGN